MSGKTTINNDFSAKTTFQNFIGEDVVYEISTSKILSGSPYTNLCFSSKINDVEIINGVSAQGAFLQVSEPNYKISTFSATSGACLMMCTDQSDSSTNKWAGIYITPEELLLQVDQQVFLRIDNQGLYSTFAPGTLDKPPIFLQEGVSEQSVLDLGALNYDGSHLYITKKVGIDNIIANCKIIDTDSLRNLGYDGTLCTDIQLPGVSFYFNSDLEVSDNDSLIVAIGKLQAQVRSLKTQISNALMVS